MGTHTIQKFSLPPSLSAHYGQISVFFGRNFSLDNNLIGNTPLSQLKLEEGTYTVITKMPGYKDWTRQVRVIANSTITFEAKLEKSQ